MDKNRFHTEARGSGKTMQRSVMMMAEGNPGCMQFLVELISIGEYSKLATLAKFGISGSRAYQLWNDCCDRDTKKAAEVLQLAQDGKISREELYEHVFQPRGTAFDLEEIRNREAKPERELDDIIIELLMQNETTEPEEELTEKTKELIKEATPLCRETKAYQRSYCKMRGKRSSSKELYMEMLLKMAMAPTRFHTMATPRIFIPYIYEALLTEGAYKDGNKTDNVRIVGYAMTYSNLTDELEKKRPEEYKLAILYARYLELLKGMAAKRINKPNKEGTTIKYEACSSAEELKKEVKTIEAVIKEMEEEDGK